MVYFVENDDEKRAIRETKNDLLWEAATAARRAVTDRLRKKEQVTSAEKKAALQALNALSRIFW